jgi:hypothetical protein
MLTDPEARSVTIAPDFSNLVVVIAQTGEWSITGEFVDQHILPFLRTQRANCRCRARNGPTKKDGITVPQETRQPRATAPGRRLQALGREPHHRNDAAAWRCPAMFS